MRNRVLPAISMAFALTLIAGTALADPPTMVGDSGLGKVLTDSKGMTLYTFAPDKDGKSACNGRCAEAWPPLMAESGAMAEGDYSIITRDDGSHQWAYKGMPLYGWVKDKKPGDTTGDGVKDGAWKAARP